MTKEPKSRIYWRNGKAYGDFRKYADVGGKREALKQEGMSVPTTDSDTALDVYLRRVRELKMRRKDQGLFGVVVEDRGLAAYASYHLSTKAREGEVTRRWLVELERHLRAAIEFFGADRALRSIRPEHPLPCYPRYCRGAHDRQREEISRSDRP